MKTTHLCKPSFILRSYNFPLVVGICVGIAVSLIFTPPFSMNCAQFTSHFSNGLKLPNLRDIRSNDIDDFEPNLVIKDNEINKNGDLQKETSKLKRPRYYSTELGMKDKLLVSVISTVDSVGLFGIAVNKTLNHYVDKLIFFVDGTGSKKFGLHIPIVGFKESKPLIKIFRVLSYIHENYIEDYNYFMFVTDHTYINGQRLMLMLDKLSIYLNIHMGTIQDNGDSLYCSLDNGIILSQSILKAVGKELLWCTKHSFSDSDSDNLGRCILHASNVPCSSLYQNEIFTSYSLQDQTDLSHFLSVNYPLESSFARALTVAVTRKAHIYELYIYFIKQFVERTKGEIVHLREEIANAAQLSTFDIFSLWPTGSPNPHAPTGRSDIIRWETFNSTHLFMPDDFEAICHLSSIDRHDIENIAEAGVAHLRAKSSKEENFSYEGLHYGHRKYDPTRGMDYILSLTFKNSNGERIYKNIEAFRGLTQSEIIPMPYVTESTRVNIVLFIQTSDVHLSEGFLTRLLEHVKIEQLTLIFHLLFVEGESYLGKDDPYKDLKSQLKIFTKRYYNAESRATFSHITVPQKRPPPLALLDFALTKLPKDGIILLIDPKATLKDDFVNRARMSTIKNWQVFSPIPFTLYHPRLVSVQKSYSKEDVTRDNGHFDRFDFTTISFYMEDYMKARKLISKKIPLFRSEKDLNKAAKYSIPSIYELFVNASDLHVLRGVEPSLVMHYTPIDCTHLGPDNPEKKSCETRRSLSFGTRIALSRLVSSLDNSKTGALKNYHLATP